MRHHMAWVIASEADKPILDEIKNQTDRGAALIATAYLEERLLAAIKARIVRDESLENELFRGSGPLAAFSVKIDFGFMLGIFDASVHKMLHTIRKIRNEFAHKPEPRDFNSQRIGDLCKNISIVNEITIKHQTTGEIVQFRLEPDGTPKTAFMNAIKYLLLVAEAETKNRPLRVPAAPIVPSPRLAPLSDKKS
jgi:DNA-binding MltR family transcriptional regulator